MRYSALIATGLAATACADAVEKRALVYQTSVSVTTEVVLVTVTAGDVNIASRPDATGRPAQKDGGQGGYRGGAGGRPEGKGRGQNGHYGGWGNHGHGGSNGGSGYGQPAASQAPAQTQAPKPSKYPQQSAPAQAPAQSAAPVQSAPKPSAYQSAPAQPAPSSPSYGGGSSGGNASAGCSDAYCQKAVASHNSCRNFNSCGGMTWDADLAASAKALANECNFHHDTTLGPATGYGQNIAAGIPEDEIDKVIMDLWYAGEMAYYPGYGSSSPDMSNFEKWGHYPQVVWEETTKVGCATVKCPNGVGSVGGNVPPYMVVCNYSPAGNMAGAYGQNVKQPKGGCTDFCNSNGRDAADTCKSS